MWQVDVGGGNFASYELVSCKCVDTYVRVKKNQNQICWKWCKVRPFTLLPAPSQGAWLRRPCRQGLLRCRRGGQGCDCTARSPAAHLWVGRCSTGHHGTPLLLLPWSGSRLQSSQW